MSIPIRTHLPYSAAGPVARPVAAFQPGRFRKGQSESSSRILAIPEERVVAAAQRDLRRVLPAPPEYPQSIPGALRTSSRDVPDRSGTLGATAAVDRFLFSGRILARSRGVVQSVHRPASRSNRSAGRRSALRSEPARHWGRAHFLNHVSNRYSACRSSNRRDNATGFLTEPTQVPNLLYREGAVRAETRELGLTREFTRRVLNKLGDSFTLEDLRAGLQAEQFRLPDGMSQEDQKESQGIWMLARSNYEVQFQPDQELSERIIFPATPSQRNGIEDARFVRFQNEDGTHVYYATFTAYDGRVVMPELVETSDFLLLPIHHIERSSRAEQRYGAVPAKNKRPLCHALAAG